MKLKRFALYIALTASLLLGMSCGYALGREDQRQADVVAISQCNADLEYCTQELDKAYGYVAAILQAIRSRSAPGPVLTQ